MSIITQLNYIYADWHPIRYLLPFSFCVTYFKRILNDVVFLETLQNFYLLLYKQRHYCLSTTLLLSINFNFPFDLKFSTECTGFIRNIITIPPEANNRNETTQLSPEFPQHSPNYCFMFALLKVHYLLTKEKQTSLPSFTRIKKTAALYSQTLSRHRPAKTSNRPY